MCVVTIKTGKSTYYVFEANNNIKKNNEYYNKIILTIFKIYENVSLILRTYNHIYIIVD